MKLMNNAKTGALLALLIALAGGVGYFVAGMTGLIVGFLFGGIGSVISWYNADKIVLHAMGGREVSREEAPDLYAMVERLCQRGGLPMPRICITPEAAPNAFATGRNPENAMIGITEGMLRSFGRDDIEAVIAHELGHVRHRDTTTTMIASVMGAAISSLAYVVFFFGGHRDSPLGVVGMLATIILAPIAAVLIQAAISRSREYVADAYAGELTGDPNQLARALGRLQSINDEVPVRSNPSFNNLYIVEPLNAGAAMTKLFSTHPPLEKRIAALNEQAARGRA